MRFKKTNVHSNERDAFAQKLAKHILQGQLRIANYLNKRTGNLSGKSVIAALIVFCSLFGGYCLYLLLSSTITH